MLKNFTVVLGPHRKAYIFSVIAASAIIGSEVLIHPLLTKAIFDAVAQRQNFSHLVYLAIAYLTFGLTINIVGYFMNLWQMKVDNKIISTVSQKMLQSYYNHDYSEIIKNGSGYYISRIRSDVKDGLEPMLGLVRGIFISIVSFILLISVLIFLSWQAFVILAVVIPLSTLISMFVGKRIRTLTSIERDSEAAVTDVLKRSIDAFKIVRSFNLSLKTLATFSNSINFTLNSKFEKSRVILRLQTGSDLTMSVSDACSIFVGAFLVFYRQMTFGSFIAFMNSFWRSTTTLVSIVNDWGVLVGYAEIIDRINSFNDSASEAKSEGRKAGLSIDRASYDYGEKSVDLNISETIKSGERVLIVGGNGTGKTTLANIMSGLLTPTTGSISLPPRINFVTLPIHFPPIPLGELPIDFDLLKRLDPASGITSEMQLDQLSVGQQQKVALALALTTDADLYIFDEPLANLDMSSRAIAMQEIWRKTDGQMLVMIMHDVEDYLSLFDRVIRLGETSGDVSEHPR